MDIYEKMKELNVELPKPAPKGGVYNACHRFNGNLIYVSGCGPVIGTETASGKLGKEYTAEEGKRLARNSMLNVLAALQQEVGDLNKVEKAVKTLVFVASDDSFTEQPAVANGGSELLAQLFGQEKVPARSAIGVNVLPGNIPVETEAIFELKENLQAEER